MIIAENKADRTARERAYALAESGQYESVTGVERAMIAEGWPNASRIVRGDYVKQAVEERCLAAHKQSS